jgi:hypothetical protein
MNKVIYIILCLLALVPLFANVQAINSLPGTGERVAPPLTREYSFCYHDSTDDIRFYGPSEWAVRFDFGAVHDTTFTVQKARLYFPNTGYSVTASLHEDTVSGPGILITQKTSAITSNWTDIVFSSPPTRRVIWLVVTDTTNAYSRWVSASDGGGTRSYFKNNAYNPYWQKFSEVGFNCELLFSLIGHFNLGNTPDLELIDFGFTGLMLPRERVNPTFSIYNHGPDDVTDWQIDIGLTNPNQEVTSYTITGLETIPHDTLLVINAPGYDFPIDMPMEPMQLKLEANLVSQYQESDNDLANNYISKTIAVYSEPLALHLVENFQRNGSGYPTPVNAGFDHLLYYPNQSDQYSNLGAFERFNWYAFNSLPKVVIDGGRRFNYYDSTTYLDDYSEAISNARAYKSFITRSSCTISHDSTNTETITTQIKLFNDSTLLFESPLSNPTRNARFFVGLFKKFSLTGFEPYILDRWLNFGSTIDSTLNIGTSLTKTYTFNAAGIDSTDLVLNYRIYYWLQEKNGCQILYAGSANFSGNAQSDAEDEVIPIPCLSVYPNPLRAGCKLKISGLETRANLTIYNLKGQKVWQGKQLAGDVEIPDNVFSSSGIYFVRRDFQRDGKTTKQTTKISIIK